MRIENGRDSVTRLTHTHRERGNERSIGRSIGYDIVPTKEGGREGGLAIIPIYHALYSRETDRERLIDRLIDRGTRIPRSNSYTKALGREIVRRRRLRILRLYKEQGSPLL